ncbi:17445_t:CDS:2 [Funneliformis caledonium]|uniref:17445_t:CDS:1 n=1 Tax=Funneliformis caledonium TaxID=1117310 RepID=A0A9N9EPF0_9GLOM|nr:17445_t:CDS:2 [Funneliformis caledonium]
MTRKVLQLLFADFAGNLLKILNFAGLWLKSKSYINIRNMRDQVKTDFESDEKRPPIQ